MFLGVGGGCIGGGFFGWRGQGLSVGYGEGVGVEDAFGYTLEWFFFYIQKARFVKGI